jgi:hypothetical protein
MHIWELAIKGIGDLVFDLTGKGDRIGERDRRGKGARLGRKQGWGTEGG